MTDTPLDLDAILAAHASASPYGRTEVAGRFHASYYADDADVALVFASIPALIAALRKANAQVAAVLALCDGVMPSSPYTLAAEIRAVVAAAEVTGRHVHDATCVLNCPVKQAAREATS